MFVVLGIYNFGNRAAARAFNVGESSIRKWRANEDKFQKRNAGEKILENLDLELVVASGEQDASRTVIGYID